MIHDLLLRTQVAALFKEGWSTEDISAELELPLEDVIEYCNKLF